MKKTVMGWIGVLLFASATAPAADREVFTLAYDTFEAFIWTEDGAAQGLYVDILTEALEERLGVPVRFKEYPWARAQVSVSTGLSDGMVTLPTPSRLQYVASGRVPVAVSALGIFTYAGHPRFEEMKKIETLEDLGEYSLMTYLGDGWAETHLADHDVEYGGNNFSHVLNKLVFQRRDIFVQTEEVTRHNINRLGLQDDIAQVPGVVLDNLEFKLLVSKESPFLPLLPKIDDALRDMKTDGTMEAMYQHYQ